MTRPPVTPEALAFQPAAVALDEQPLPGPAARLPFVLAALLAAAVVWAVVAEVEPVVTAPGRLVPSSSSVTVQSLVSGTLQRLEVKPGDVVKAGQVVAALDPTVSLAELRQTRVRLASLQAEVARLEGELTDTLPSPVGGPKDAQQTALRSDRRADYDARVAVMRQRIAKVEASLATNEAEGKRQKATAAIASEKEGLFAKLAESSRLERLQGRQESLRAEHAAAALTDQRRELERELEVGRAELDTLTTGWRLQGREQLVNATRERDRVAEDLTKAERAADLILLRAPVDGTVLEVAAKAAGSALKDGEVLVSIVPTDVPLEAEVLVPSADIGLIRDDDPARITMDTFPFQRHGSLDGTVRVISPDAVSPPPAGDRSQEKKARADAYRVRVAVTANHLRHLPAASVAAGGREGQPTAGLRPGMWLKVDVKSGKRRVITYLLDPLIQGLDESLREPR